MEHAPDGTRSGTFRYRSWDSPSELAAWAQASCRHRLGGCDMGTSAIQAAAPRVANAELRHRRPGSRVPGQSIPRRAGASSRSRGGPVLSLPLISVLQSRLAAWRQA